MIEGDAELQPYPDGTWWVNEHRVSSRFPIVCRGNTGEVYPNVVSPITGSLVGIPFARGQCRLALEAGMMSKAQLAGLDGRDSALSPMFAGYIYGNVSMARSGVARMPGMTTDMIDRQVLVEQSHGDDLRDGTEVRIPIDQLAVGDRFVVRPGKEVATDGRVEDGVSANDAPLLTGEPVPVEVGPGDSVTGATAAEGAGNSPLASRVRLGCEISHPGRTLRMWCDRGPGAS